MLNITEQMEKDVESAQEALQEAKSSTEKFRKELTKLAQELSVSEASPHYIIPYHISSSPPRP